MSTININVSKLDMGLDQVDNTSDLNKPISTATQTALDNIDLQSVTDLGNTTTDNIEFTGGVGVLFDNTSTLRKGTIDAGYGGAKGIAQVCAVGYELKWEAGRLYVMGDGGTTIREVSHNFTTTPSATDDNTKGFIVGSRWILDNGDLYVCTDVTTATAVWVLQTIDASPTDGSTKAVSSNGVFDALADKVDKVVGSRLITTAEGTVLSNTSGTNTGDQTLQTVTNLGNDTTTNITSSSVSNRSTFSPSAVQSAGLTGGKLTSIHSDGKVQINTTGSATGVLKASNLAESITLEFPNKVSGTYTVATTADFSGTNTGDQIISDATITTTDITTNNFTTAKHGFVPKGTNVGNFLKDDGTWGTPAGGGSGVCGIKNSSGVYTYYATLNLAITAAVSGQTVDILTDITETGSVTVTTKTGVKINGNGYTYTLSVNDATNAITQAIESTLEIFNLKVVRTGRSGGSTGRVLVSNFYSNSTLKCQNVVFESTYGEGVSYLGFIYGLNIITYGSCVVGDAGAYNCNFTSSNGLGIDNSSSAKEVINCNVSASGTAINMTYGSVYDSVGRSSSGIGIFAFRIVNSMGVSVSNTGIGTTGHSGYNCVGISTSGVGLNGTFTNSTGVSTSGYGGTNGTKTNCTLISSSNYASFQENLNNSFLQSTTNVPIWLSTGKLVNECTAICLWDNAGGHAINTTSAATGVDIRNSSLTVTNASAYCINGASASTFKYANNSFKGSTVAVNATNITQGITNLSDTKGNILI